MDEQLEFSFIFRKDKDDVFVRVMEDVEDFLMEVKKIYTVDSHREIQSGLLVCLNFITPTVEQSHCISQYRSILNTLDLD